MESNGIEDKHVLEELLEEKEKQLQELQRQLKSERKRRRSYKKECRQLKNVRKCREVECQTVLKVTKTCCICQINVFSKDAESQTFETDFCPVDSANSALDWHLMDGSNQTISDIVKETAEAAMKSDYVYDEGSQMFYSMNTGYYYDPKSSLFYEPHSKVYYSYDAATQEYSFHSQLVDDHVVVNSESQAADACRAKRANRKKAKKKVQTTKEGGKDSDLEEGEVRDSGAEEESAESDSATSYPPSLRMIVRESEKLQEGSLLLVTYKGATVGREENLDVCIPDTCVSRTHARITYDESEEEYNVRDLGSQNGTFVNGEKLVPGSKNGDEAGHPVRHGETISFGGCTLLVHIHDGHNTCNGCEPGVLQSGVLRTASPTVAVLSKKEREEQRKQNLRQMKKRYGLQNSDYTSDQQSDVQKHGYKDRADHRRKTKGSSNPYEKDAEPAALDKPLPVDNKGYKMLEKMGWASGEGLGQSQPGILEPINVNIQFDRAGLGARTEDATT